MKYEMCCEKVCFVTYRPLVKSASKNLFFYFSTKTYVVGTQKNRRNEVVQGSHRLEKYFNLEGFLEKSLKSKSALKSTGKSLKGLEKSLNSSIFCRT